MLHISTEIVCALIQKARVFQAKEEVVFEDDIPDIEYEYDWTQVLADHQDDLTFKEVQKTIADLELDQRIDLLAIMYVGRGDYSASAFKAARQAAKKNIRPHLTEYLFSKPMIADFLEEGLKQLGFSCD